MVLWQKKNIILRPRRYLTSWNALVWKLFWQKIYFFFCQIYYFCSKIWIIIFILWNSPVETEEENCNKMKNWNSSNVRILCWEWVKLIECKVLDILWLNTSGVKIALRRRWGLGDQGRLRLSDTGIFSCPNIHKTCRKEEAGLCHLRRGI